MDDEPNLTKVTRQRRDGFSAAKRRIFLDKLRNTCNVRAACQAANISRETVYTHKQDDPEFAAQWEQAEQEAVDLLEAKAWNNAMQKDSETSLWNLLKAHRPQKYREVVRQQHEGPDGGPIAVQVTEVVIKHNEPLDSQ